MNIHLKDEKEDKKEKDKSPNQSTPQPRRNGKGSVTRNPAASLSDQTQQRSLLFKDFAIIRHNPTYTDGPSNQDGVSAADKTPMNESDRNMDNFKSASKRSPMKQQRLSQGDNSKRTDADMSKSNMHETNKHMKSL